MEQSTLRFDAESVKGIVDHMNEDHTEALHLYIKAFTDIESACIENLQMTDIDADGITLAYSVEGEKNQSRILFVDTIGKPLTAVAGVRGALVAMVRIARR